MDESVKMDPSVKMGLSRSPVRGGDTVVRKKAPLGPTKWYRNWHLLFLRVPVALLSAVLLGILVRYDSNGSGPGICTGGTGGMIVCGGAKYSRGEGWWTSGMIITISSILLTLFEIGRQFFFTHVAPKTIYFVLIDGILMLLSAAGIGMLATSRESWKKNPRPDDLDAIFALLFLMIPAHLILVIGGVYVWRGRREKSASQDAKL